MWDYRYGGANWEFPFVLVETPDGCFLSGGYSYSPISFDKTDSLRGHEDYWIVKTNSNGIILWAKTYGGTEQDILTSILILPDSGFLLGGYSRSGLNGDKTSPNRNPLIAGADYWIVRTDKNGNKIWDKTFGGDLDDFLTDMIICPDGSFILGGYTSSDSTDDMSHHNFGNTDYWIVKTDNNGNKLWDFNYGATLYDVLNSLVLTPDNGIILGGSSNSPPGNSKTQPICTGSLNEMDFWILKIDSTGIIQWDKRMGGNDFDKLVFIRKTPNNKYLFCGFSASGISCEKTGICHGPSGYQDFWIVCTDSSFNILWDKSYGGDLAEDEINNVVFLNNQIIILGTSYSSASGDKTDNNVLNMEQAWIIAVDTLGNKLWDKTINNPVHTEYCTGLVTKDGCLLLLSMADAFGGDVSQTRNSMYDYWLVKYCSSVVLPEAEYTVSSTTFCENTCIDLINLSQNATSFLWLFPGGSPATDTSVHPQNICYFNSGNYDVTLIASNASGSDTFLLPNYLTVHPAVQISPVVQHGDTLFTNQGFATYQWYYGTALITGANNYFYVASQSGSYSVQVSDSNGCEGVATLLGVVASVDEKEKQKDFLTVNYTNGEVQIFISSHSDSKCKIEILDVSGKIVATKNDNYLNGQHVILISNWDMSKGFYFVNVSYGNQRLKGKLFFY